MCAIFFRTIAAGAALVCLTAYAQGPVFPEREKFLQELTSTFLGTNGQALSLGLGKGWKGVVLAPLGTPTASLMTPFEGYGADNVSASRLLEGAYTYDRALYVNKGVGTPGPASLSELWELVLTRSRPDNVVVEPVETDPSIAILFKQGDSVDRSRGVVFKREPSDAMLRYREYELTLRALAGEDVKDTGFWRMNPNLSKFASLQEAKMAIADDWLTYGYKREIDAARDRLATKSSTKAWIQWSNAQATFTSARLFINPELSVSQTILFPAPSEWIHMSTWLRIVGETSDPNVKVIYQTARVRIIRRWLLIESLLDGQIRLRKNSAVESPVILSDGIAPTLLDYPTGLLAVVPDELVLIRSVRFVAKDSTPEQRVSPRADHPLGLFAYPDEINLLGYIVRALPRLIN